jgi:exodeoxyribonuclease VII large subunit
MPVYTVSQVTSYLKESLERDSLLKDLWVTGEISNFTRSVAGHLYFTLKDGTSQLRCVMFRGGSGGELLGSGVAVSIHGRISIYEVRGDLQLYVDVARPEGLGELYLELERLKVQLEAQGLFSPARKRPLPLYPRRIGVITSPTGAVWHDIQSVVSRRYPLAELVLAPCMVQGDHAIASIIEAFEVLAEETEIDVILLARGGGSLEELLPFNTEAIARAIYASQSPVVSAVGHETDVTIADLVADLRAPTPSAAAELTVPDMAELRSAIMGSQHLLLENVLGEVEKARASCVRLTERLHSRVPDFASRRQRVDETLRAATFQLTSCLSLYSERLGSMGDRLGSLDPKSVLTRGYAIVQHGLTGNTVQNPSQVQSGDPVTIRVQDGSFDATVTKVPLDEGLSTM